MDEFVKSELGKIQNIGGTPIVQLPHKRPPETQIRNPAYDKNLKRPNTGQSAGNTELPVKTKDVRTSEHL